MSAEPGHAVRTASIRVALGAGALVALGYLAVAAAVFVIVTNNLTAQIDGRLTDSLRSLTSQQPPEHGGFDAPPGGPRFGPQLLVWTIHADGKVDSNTLDAALPASVRGPGSPRTVTIGGAQVRVAGETVVPGFTVVVGQSMDSVGQAQATLLLAEALIGPVLLVLVFLGAVAIGRRVASPIEQARHRQLEFTADASHELRTPLSVIEAETSLALGRERDATWYRTAFVRVDGETRRMRRLLDDLLWLARFDATRGAPHAEPVDVGLLAGQAVERFRSVAETRHLRLGLDVRSDATAVSAPPEWLDRLLGVLLDNACKYAPPGGTVQVSVARESGRVRLTVEDAGPGIPEDQRDRIFDRFHRATDSAGGAGLGLAIANEIVRATGGRWRIGTSTLGGASMSAAWPGL
ncbi:MAG: sensor histidine kinase [Candidatus Limnocylindrales bacterium]